MGSPRIEVFFVRDMTTGALLPGQLSRGMAFELYKNDLGSDLSQPTIREIGGGAYCFTPVFADPSRGIVYQINTGSNGNPTSVGRFMRPEDWYTDNMNVDAKTLATKDDLTALSLDSLKNAINDLHVIGLGHWKIDKESKTLIFYDKDEVPFKVFELKGDNGAPNTEDIYERIPV